MSDLRRRFLDWLVLVRLDLSQTHSRAQKPLLAMLIEADEMPTGQWKTTSDQAFRPEKGASPELGRARSNGDVKVLRHIKNIPAHRAVAVLLIPFASDDDALSYLPKSVNGIFGNPFSRTNVKSRGIVEVEELSALSPSVAYEIEYDGPHGLGRQRFIATVVGRVFVQASFSALEGGMWSWEEVAVVAGRQVAKIREGLAHLRVT